MSRFALLAAVLAVIPSGCSDSSSGPSDAKPPSLSIAATNACGRNILPVPTREQLQENNALLMAVTIRGVDPANTSGTMTGGTEVEVFIQGDGEEDITKRATTTTRLV